MTALANALGPVLNSLGREAVDEVIIGFPTIADWADGFLAGCLQARLFMVADQASTLVCPGCQESCITEVIGSDLDNGPFIFCDQPHAHGRIEFEKLFLDQWKCSRRLVAVFVAHELGQRIARFDDLSGRTEFGLNRSLGVKVTLEFNKTAILLIGDQAYELIDLLCFSGKRILDRSGAPGKTVSKRASAGCGGKATAAILGKTHRKEKEYPASRSVCPRRGRRHTSRDAGPPEEGCRRKVEGA